MKPHQPILLIVFVLAALLATAQSTTLDAELSQARFVESFGHTRSIASDNDGNLYHLLWVLNETTHVGGGASVELGTNGQLVMHLLKYDADMTLQWAMPLAQLEHLGIESCPELGALDVDEGGNIYVGGAFGSATNFNPFAEAVELDTQHPQVADAFVAKYSPDGLLDWIETYPAGGGHAEITALNAGAEGRIYAGLRFRADLVHPDFQIDRLTSFGTDAALLALDQDGTYLWHFQPEAFSHQGISAIAAQPSGSLAYGRYAHLDMFGGGQLYAGALNGDGNPLWEKQLAQINGSIGAFHRKRITAISMGPDGSVYLGGTFTGVAAFNEAASLADGVQATFTDGFVAKYSFESGDFHWAQVLRSPTLKSYVNGLRVHNDQVQVAGHYMQSMELGSGAEMVSLETNSVQMYLASFDATTGNVIAATNLQLTQSAEMHIAHFMGENALAVGGYTVDSFGNDEISVLGPLHFLALYQFDATLQSNNTDMSQRDLLVYPNPAQGEVRLSGAPDGVLRISLSDISGRVVKEFNDFQVHGSMDVSGMPQGLYLLQVSGMGWQGQAKVVLE